MAHDKLSSIASPSDAIEWCARELEWMSRVHVGHEAVLILLAAKRLHNEADKILQRAVGIPA